MSEFVKYRELGTKTVSLLSVTDDYGNLIPVSNISEQHNEFLHNRCDWHEISNDSALPVLRVPAKAFDFKARAEENYPVSADRPLPKLPVPAQRAEDKFSIPLRCAISGIPLGKFVPSVGLAVATPYVKAWKESAFVHPIFSLSLREILHKVQSCWELEKSGTRSFPMFHKQLQFVAMLHISGLIKQDVAGLPNPKIVETQTARLFELLTWRYDLASDRMQMPRLHVWIGADRADRSNIFASVPTWLDACEIAKDEYENIARSRMNAAKARAKEMALKTIRKAMYSDISLKRLWNWIEAQVPSSVLDNNPDFEQLFFAEEMQIHNWEGADIEAFESTILEYCELGNSVSSEVSKRIRQLAEWRNTYSDTFEIIPDTRAQFAEHEGKPEPMPQGYPSRAAYLVAHAKWKLANKDSSVKDKDDL